MVSKLSPGFIGMERFHFLTFQQNNPSNLSEKEYINSLFATYFATEDFFTCSREKPPKYHQWISSLCQTHSISAIFVKAQRPKESRVIREVTSPPPFSSKDLISQVTLPTVGQILQSISGLPAETLNKNILEHFGSRALFKLDWINLLGISKPQDLFVYGIYSLRDLQRILMHETDLKQTIIDSLKDFILKSEMAHEITGKQFLQELKLKGEWESTAKFLLEPGGLLFNQNMSYLGRLTPEEWNFLELGSVGQLIKVIESLPADSLKLPCFDLIQKSILARQSQLKNFRACTKEAIQKHLTLEPYMEKEEKPWLDQLVQWHGMRPILVQECIKESKIRRFLLFSILKMIPTAINPFKKPISSFLRAFSYVEFKIILTKAPELYFYFTYPCRIKLFEEFKKEPQKALPAMIALAEYPLYWKEVFPFLSQTQTLFLMASSPILSSLTKILEPYPEELKEFQLFFFKYSRVRNHVLNKINSFFRFEEDQWKLFIDPRYHHLGPHVFDQGLHGGEVEPGYLNSMKAAAIWLASKFGKKLNVWHYDLLHKIVMSHHQKTKIPFRFVYREQTSSHIVYERKYILNFLKEADQVIEEFKAMTHHVRTVPALEEVKKLGQTDSIHLPHTIKIHFDASDPIPTDPVVMSLMNEIFDSKEIDQAKSRQEKLRAIVKRYQKLERNHLFADGNSRTHALILQKDLIDNGFMPAFFDPNGSYLVSTNTLISEISACMEEVKRKYPF